MNKKTLKIALLTMIVSFMALSVDAQVIERMVKATETLETGVNFIYKTVNIPVADVTYHEFSADSITWRKNFVAGDCYVRFNNYSDNSVTKHPTARWWGLNICTLGQGTGGSIDTMFVYYYQNDTIYSVDTIVVSGGVVDINIPAPDTITGSTTNYQDTLSHTHALYVNLNDLEDVNATPTNGQVLKYNGSLGVWVASNDLIGGGGSTLIVEEEDGTPSVSPVTEIRVANGKLTDNGIGSVSIDFSLDAILGAQEFFRTGTQRVGEGDPFIVFGTPFTAADYIVTSAFALYDNQTRQNLVPDSLTVNGFKVLSILEDSATVTYVAMRALDSLGLAVTDQGRVMASGSDPTLGYLNQSVDDSTITVTSNELHVVNALTADEVLKLQDSVPTYEELLDTTLAVAIDEAHINKLTVDSLVFTDTYWDDMSLALVSTASGVAAPDMEPFRGSTVFARAFAGTVVNEAMFVEGQFTHRIKTSSAIEPHWHISPSTTPVATDTVVLVFEYTWAAYGTVFPASQTITTKIPLNGKAQWEHIIYDMSSNIPAIGDQESSIILGRVARLQDNVSDTYTSDLFIFNLDLHYSLDKPGSPDEIPD